MIPFLQQTAESLLQQYGSALADCTLVFPNRRAILFFNKYLSSLYENPQWAPEAKTVNEFVQSLSGLHSADSMTLIFELYKIYKKEKKSEETFDEFYFWGEMLVNDFDDLDKYLVNPKELFQNLASLKEIDNQFAYLTHEQIEVIRQFWQSFNPQKFSQHQDDFIEIWNVLHTIYLKFNEHLNSLGIAYEGMVYRQVAGLCKSGTLDISGFKKIIFIGFNALNNCEKELFDYLKKSGIAEFHWDYDEYYLQNKYHEAGLFLRENLIRYPAPEISDVDRKVTFTSMTDTPKNIEFIAVSSDIGQAKFLNTILKNLKLGTENDLTKTAVVLADESLLLPVLYSLPPEIDNINITMGYPLRATHVYSLLEHIIELQKSAKKDPDRFYFRSVLKILNHQYIKTNFENITDNLIADIVRHNRVYIKGSDLHSDDLLKLIFTHHIDADSLTKYLLDILMRVYSEVSDDMENPTLSQEYIFSLYTSIKKIYEILRLHEINFGLTVYLRLLRQVIQNVRIPFEGEPLSGLQVMGILETRSIDFENLIVLSMNEGVLPKSGGGSSFIPYNLRKVFGMPTVEYQDAMYAYYFYRLIQRAENISLVYNTSTNGASLNGEMSRFLLQMKYESGFNIIEKIQNYDISFPELKPISIEKNEEVLTQLRQYLSNEKDARYFSASAINSYIDCPLKFYFNYIAGLKETDEVTEDIDAAVFGTLLHKVMYLLYEPFAGKIIDVKNFDEVLKNQDLIKQVILKAFQHDYFLSEKEIEFTEITGKNILIFEMLKKYALQILEVDKQLAPFQIVELEKNYTALVSVLVNHENKSANIGGIIDRVDRAGGRLRVVDYKTGPSEKSFVDVPSLFDKEKNKRGKAVFQTFFYASLFSNFESEKLDILPCLYFTREAFAENFDSGIYQKAEKNKQTFVSSFKEYAADFKIELKQVLSEIFDQSNPFCQTENPDVCRYCPYIEICHRG